jgi:hypothetical protein
MAQRRPLASITALFSGLLLLMAGPGAAKTVIGQSVWSKSNALGRAQALLPAGAVVSSSDCQTVEIGMDNERYICSITYELPPAGTKAPGPSQPAATGP